MEVRVHVPVASSFLRRTLLAYEPNLAFALQDGFAARGSANLGERESRHPISIKELSRQMTFVTSNDGVKGGQRGT